MTSPRPLKVDNQITFRLSAENPWIPRSTWTTWIKTFAVSRPSGVFSGTPSGFPRNVVPRSHARKPIFRANSERFGATSHGARRIRSRKMLGPKFLGPQNDEIQHPAVGGWGSYIFFDILSASAIFRAVGLQIDLRFLEAGLICCRLWRWCSTLGDTLGNFGLI